MLLPACFLHSSSLKTINNITSKLSSKHNTLQMIIKLFTLAASMTTPPSGLHSSWFDDLDDFWKSWNLRMFVILSFCIQCFLIIGASFRKQRTSRALIGLIWLAYVLADWAAYYALGLISNSTSYCSTTSRGNLHGFWAPFLLLHLGGPSTITAFSLDDTSMWVRSGLNLVVQTMAALFAFIDLLPDNNLWIASLFIFFAAIIRYSDRVLSLYIASSTMSNVKDTVNKRAVLGTAHTLETVEETTSPLTLWGDRAEDVQLGKDAYGFFEMYKGLYGDLFYPYTDDEWMESKVYFSRLDAPRAFELMEIELSLAYEIFYTKVGLLQKCIERILYPFSTCCVIVAFVLWIVTSKDEYNTVDVVITYALLIGSLVVDLYSAFVILFSAWMLAYFITSNRARQFRHLTKALVTVKLRRWATNYSGKRGIHSTPSFRSAILSQIFFPHWSDSILQLNMVDYCFNDRSKFTQTLLLKYYQIIGYPTSTNLSEVGFTAKLRDFMFTEIRARGESELALGKGNKLCSGKARWILKQYYGSSSNRNNTAVWNPFGEAFHTLEYDECLLVLHIATDMLFRTNPPHTVGTSDNNEHERGNEWRGISKVLSDYMLYLLVLRQKMIFVPACRWETLFPDTCEEFKRVAKEAVKHHDAVKKTNLDEEASERFMEVGCKSQNKVISRACTLATNLRHYEERHWEILSKVWMEMTCHAAIHSRGSAHGEQLSMGGELLTFVWLMLAHFKIGKQLLYLDDDEDDDQDMTKMAYPESPSTGAEDNWQF